MKEERQSCQQQEEPIAAVAGSERAVGKGKKLETFTGASLPGATLHWAAVDAWQPPLLPLPLSEGSLPQVSRFKGWKHSEDPNEVKDESYWSSYRGFFRITLLRGEYEIVSNKPAPSTDL